MGGVAFAMIDNRHQDSNKIENMKQYQGGLKDAFYYFRHFVDVKYHFWHQFKTVKNVFYCLLLDFSFWRPKLLSTLNKTPTYFFFVNIWIRNHLGPDWISLKKQVSESAALFFFYYHPSLQVSVLTMGEQHLVHRQNHPQLAPSRQQEQQQQLTSGVRYVTTLHFHLSNPLTILYAL